MEEEPAAIEIQNTIWIKRLKPSPHSPKANIKDVTTTIITAMEDNTGPLMVLCKSCNLDTALRLLLLMSANPKFGEISINIKDHGTRHLFKMDFIFTSSDLIKHNFIISSFFQQYNSLNKPFFVSTSLHCYNSVDSVSHQTDGRQR